MTTPRKNARNIKGPSTSGTTLAIKPIPGDDRPRHPDMPNDVYPKHEFCVAVVAPRGSGKTTLLVNILMQLEQYFHTILIASPSILSDQKWDTVRKKPLLKENTELRDYMRKQQEKAEQTYFGNVVTEPPPNKATQTKVDKPDDASSIFSSDDDDDDPRIIPKACWMKELSASTVAQIRKEQLDMIKKIKKLQKNAKQRAHSRRSEWDFNPISLLNRICLVLDDQTGGKLFAHASTKTDMFNKLVCNHRHHSLSIIMVAHEFKQIPPVIRNNLTGLITFKTGNDKEIEKMYEEFTLGLDQDAWFKMFHYATSGPHDFLFINNQINDRTKRAFRNFEQCLEIHPDDDDTANTT